ncbi:4'-phosphopantetheinyl transferase superfamily protein [Patescibacteria group bacterium]|nr:4'-phosphopantetheinyl transferase superfamily protein [Patescibacteria group bacterium]
MQAMTSKHKFWQITPRFSPDTKSLMDVCVHIARVPTDGLLLEDCLKVLDRTERERAQSFRFVEDRNAYITAHALLRFAMSHRSRVLPEDWIFRTSPSGKPEQINLPGQMYFNISHTRGMVCCALSSTSVGVDIENIDALSNFGNLDPLFNKEEINEVSCLPERDRNFRFIIYWTLRESLLKGTGEGIGGISRDFSFFVSDNKEIFLKEARHPSLLNGWKFATFLVDNHYIVSVSTCNLTNKTQNIYPNFRGEVELIGASQYIKSF